MSVQVAGTVVIDDSRNISNIGTTSSQYIYLPAAGSGVERQIMWQFSPHAVGVPRNVYFYGQDDSKNVGLWDSLIGSRWNSANTGNFSVPTLSATTSISSPTYNITADTLNRFSQQRLYLRGTDPTVVFRDTDHNSAMIHCNSNLLYVLRGNTDVEGWTQVNGQWPFAWNLTNNDASCGGNFSSVGNITAYTSDRRLKKDIETIADALEKVNQISGITYKNNELANSFGFNDDDEQVGVIAQEIEKVLPQVVAPAPFDTEIDAVAGTKKSKSGKNYMTVRYDRIVPLLIEAIKELNSQVNDMRKELEELKNK